MKKNVIWACKRCNSSKGARRLYELWTVRSGLEGAKYEAPRIAEGKYLKLLYEVFKEKGVLDNRCDIKILCVKEKSVENYLRFAWFAQFFSALTIAGPYAFYSFALPTTKTWSFS